MPKPTKPNEVLNSLVVIPFNVPWEWSTDYTNQTSFELAKKGSTVVCYLWGDARSLKESILENKFPKLITKYSQNIFLFTPIYFIPFRRFKFIANLNSVINIFLLKLFAELISFFRRIKKKIFWIFDSNLISIYKFFGNKYFLLYDCVDFFATGDKKQVDETKRNERLLCKKANLVVANSRVLKNHLFKYTKKVKLVPQGFRISDSVEKKYKTVNLNIKKPVIGFVGGVNARLDFDLLLPLAKNNPNWNFVIWGPLQEKEKIDSSTWKKMQKLISLPNITTGESKDKSEIPAIINQFDIGIIPYDVSQDFNKYCYPMKLFEYFYMGKPVISTPIEELKRFPKFVKIGNTAKEWEKHIKTLLSKPWPEKYRREQRRLAKKNSWENKVEKISHFMTLPLNKIV